MDDTECVICGQILNDDSVLITNKGLSKLRQCSEKRNDGKYSLFWHPIMVHKLCRKNYIRPQSIKQAVNLKHKRSNEELEADVEESFVKKKLRSAFVLKNKCLFCDQNIPQDYKEKETKLPKKRRTCVRMVRNSRMRNSILRKCQERSDKWSESVKEKVISVSDLVAAEAVYHHRCSTNFFMKNNKENVPPVGRPNDENVLHAMNEIFSILENDEECQFCLEELVDNLEGYKPALATVKAKLVERYGNNITFTKLPGRKTVFFLRESLGKILSDFRHVQHEVNEHGEINEQDEKLSIIKTAAAIIREDIKSQFHDSSTYPPPENFHVDVGNVVPKSLEVFLTAVTKKKKEDESLALKRLTIAHVIMTVSRPRSFISSIQLGIAEYIHKKIGSKSLVSILSNLGLCASYNDVIKFEDSCLKTDRNVINSEAFRQYVYDNADFNASTIDGYNTMHVMGGILCVTPHSAVQPRSPIPKIKTLLTSKEVSALVDDTVITYEPIRTGKQMLENIETTRRTETPSLSDVLHMFGEFLQIPNVGGWNGFNLTLTKNVEFLKSAIIYLPFVNLPATDENAILTVLHQAAEGTAENNQKTTFVTFDQPLYAKAKNVLASVQDEKLSNVVVRLGGFHLLMSFLGCIGNVMAESGLKELWSTVYAAQSVDKMLNGHAYARAIRAHFLTQSALAKFVFQRMKIADNEKIHVQDLFLNFPENPPAIECIESDNIIQNIRTRLENTLKDIECDGATARLWVQYFRLVTLVKRFIEAERSGNWALHLDCVSNMIPFFHATAHFSYAKWAHVYLQEMTKLPQHMDPREYERFISSGFTIRRTDKFWSGVWSDLCIEQTLMRSMKSQGGLTQGRGISDSVVTRWILGMPTANGVCDSMETLANVYSVTTDQHVDMRKSRITRDKDDVDKLFQWLSLHNPFPIFEKITNIFNGLIGDGDVNCFNAYEVGKIAMNDVINKNLKDVTLKKSKCVVTMASMLSKIKIRDEVVPIDPLLLFSRIALIKQSDEELCNFFEFELSPFPLSIFDENGMRKGTKSKLYQIFQSEKKELQLSTCRNIVDGGFLLHRVVWPKNLNFKQIANVYKIYIWKHFGRDVTVVFDGYSKSEEHTKNFTRGCRYKNISPEIAVQEELIPSVAQESFLSNTSNKIQLIDLLRKEFHEHGIDTRQAVDDADVLIVETALEKLSSETTVVVIGEDVDLLVLIIALTSPVMELLFYKPGKKTPGTFFSSKTAAPNSSKTIMMYHAFTGCDSTSAIHGKGKISGQRLLKHPEIAEVFYKKDATKDEIFDAGCKAFLIIYGDQGDSCTSLNEYRYRCFTKTASKKKISLQSLPPTADAAKWHSFRVYHQVQQWRGNIQSPEEWGWRKSEQGLVPIEMTVAAAPQSLLQSISCNCGKGCEGRACSCRKMGLKCSVLCGKCEGSTCSNRKYSLEDDDMDVDEPSPIF